MGLARLPHFFLLCMVLLSLCACQKRMPAPVERMPDLFTQAGDPVEFSALGGLLSGADFILVGENHLNACTHAMQSRVIQLAGEQRPDVIVGMEMLQPVQQPVLDAFFQGNISPDELEQALDWKIHWGFPFDLYRPVFVAAREKNLRLCPLNLPREQILGMAEGREEINFPFLAASQEQTRYLRDIFSAHRAMLNKKTSEERFFKVQALWDSVMAWKAVEAGRNGQVVILAGSGHIENGWGIEYRLRHLRPAARIIRFTPILTLEELRSFQKENFDQDTTAFFFLCPSASPSLLPGKAR